MVHVPNTLGFYSSKNTRPRLKNSWICWFFCSLSNNSLLMAFSHETSTITKPTQHKLSFVETESESWWDIYQANHVDFNYLKISDLILHCLCHYYCSQFNLWLLLGLRILHSSVTFFLFVSLLFHWLEYLSNLVHLTTILLNLIRKGTTQYEKLQLR